MSAAVHSTVDAPVTKAATAIAASLTVATWTDIAAILAALYSAILIGEWVWKKWLRPYCECKGWIKRVKRRHDDYYKY